MSRSNLCSNRLLVAWPEYKSGGLVFVLVFALCNVALAFGPTTLPLPSLRGHFRSGASCFSRTRDRLRMSVAKSQSVPMAPDVRELESTTPPPPYRSVTSAGYRTDPSARTWPDFQYSSAAERRSAVNEIAQGIFQRSIQEQQVRLNSLRQRCHWQVTACC